MRITAGLWRGRTLAAPKGEATRPTADRLRQAIFNMLDARGARLEGAAVLDLFAGTGSLGLEALSRGAARATFVEAAGPPLAALERNLRALGLGPERAAVLRDDWRRAVERLAARGEAFDVVFLDPPYGEGLAAAAAARVAGAGLVVPGGFVVAEHAAAGEPMPDRPGFAGPVGSGSAASGLGPAASGLVVVVHRTYGRTALTLYQANVP